MTFPLDNASGRRRTGSYAPARALPLVALLVLSTLAGCNRQQKTETGKTYTGSDQKGGSQGGGQKGGQAGVGGDSGGQSDAKPLDAPADTTNGKPSQASDSGTSEATHNQVVAQPGSPPERKPH